VEKNYEVRKKINSASELRPQAKKKSREKQSSEWEKAAYYAYTAVAYT